MKQISIVIVTYNSEKDIFDCVSSIEAHTDIPKEDIELIIVDNCSHSVDAMFERLKQQWGEDIICIKNTRNGGYGQGNNVGIRVATASVILIMNPDVRQIMPFLKKPLHAFANNPKLTMYGMKQMLTPTLASTNSINCSNTVNGYFSTLMSGVCNRYNLFFPSFMYLNGSCFFIRKSMFEAIGLFDESIFMYGEENNIHHRLKQTFGAHVVYDTDIRYLHLTKDRVVTVESEDKILRSLIDSNAKIGCSPKTTILNKIRSLNALIWKESVGRLMGRSSSAAKIQVYKDYKIKLNALLKEYENE